MTLELEGNILVERAHTRRWVSIIAVVIPVAAFIMVSAWFIRAYVNPPTVAISSPMMVATIAPPPPPVVPTRALVEAPKPLAAPPQQRVTAEPAPRPPSQETTMQASPLPMYATLTAAPPSLASAPAAPVYAPPPVVAQPAAPERTQVMSSALPSIMVEESASVAPLEPIAGPVPVPRAKPNGSVALLTNSVPLPRPRPTEVAPPSDLPTLDRHSID